MTSFVSKPSMENADNPQGVSGNPPPFFFSGNPRKIDTYFSWITAASAAIIIVIMAGIFWELVSNSWLSIQKFGLHFLVSKEWNPVMEEFGALPSVYGTLVSTAIAMLIAVPLALLIALFLVELAPPKISQPVGIAIELLAAIPSIIYGMWGFFVFSPYMADHIQPFLYDHVQPILDKLFFGYLPLFDGAPMGIGMLTAGIILALMILPFITAVSRDVLQMVPTVLKESAYGMGSTTWEVTWKVSIPYGINGIIGALFLGLGRAIGETMAVTFVIGNAPNISGSLLDVGQSIASTLANEFAEAAEPIYLSALIELALILFILTFGIQIISHFWLKRISRNLEGRG